MRTSLSASPAAPLAPWVSPLTVWLADQGYAVASARDHLRCLRLMDEQLVADGAGAEAVDEGWIAELVEVLHAKGRAKKFGPWSFRVVVGFLRARGVVAAPPALSATRLQLFLEDYRAWLVRERGVAQLTIRGYLGAAGWFLTDMCDGDPDRVGHLTAAEVAQFVGRVARVRTPASTNTVVVGVRSLLRWLYAERLIDRPLAEATPWLARGRTSTLPRTLPAGHTEALLAACDRTTLTGARDYAVLVVLVRLGLRAGEVAAMETGDLDWRRGEVLVRSKGGGRDRLPLPSDVGDALVGYLTRRGAHPGQRRVFLRVHAPRGPMSMSGIRAVVRHACGRVGIPDTGTHRLRHAAAVDMLRGGAPLHEIGQVLRHRDLETTAMYAKVDLAALSTLAVPWPEVTR